MVGNRQQFKREYRFQLVGVHHCGKQNHLSWDKESMLNHSQLRSRIMMMIITEYSGTILFSFRISLIPLAIYSKVAFEQIKSPFDKTVMKLHVHIYWYIKVYQLQDQLSEVGETII